MFSRGAKKRQTTIVCMSSLWCYLWFEKENPECVYIRRGRRGENWLNRYREKKKIRNNIDENQIKEDQKATGRVKCVCVTKIQIQPVKILVERNEIIGNVESSWKAKKKMKRRFKLFTILLPFFRYFFPPFLLECNVDLIKFIVFTLNFKFIDSVRARFSFIRLANREKNALFSLTLLICGLLKMLHNKKNEHSELNVNGKLRALKRSWNYKEWALTKRQRTACKKGEKNVRRRREQCPDARNVFSFAVVSKQFDQTATESFSIIDGP